MDCIVITQIDRNGSGWSISGEHFDYCSYSGRHDYFSGTTQEDLIDVIPGGTVYFARTARGSISDAVYETVKNRVAGIVNRDYRDNSIRVGARGNQQCWLFNASSIIWIG